VVVRGEPASGSFLAFWLRDGGVVGAMLGNLPEARKPLEALVRGRVRADPARLADPSVPLEELLPNAGG
jgi:hypothetical protein